jgi:hypothetical protein
MEAAWVFADQNNVDHQRKKIRTKVYQISMKKMKQAVL